MRGWSIRNRLDLLNLQHAQVGEPAVESKQRVMVGAGVPGQALIRSGPIEHPAYRDAVDAGGFNAEAEDYVDMIAAGILDPAKVARSALQNAASIAALMLTTEALISEIPEDKKDAPSMPGGGGMGGMY